MKFVLVCEEFPNIFSRTVQDYLNMGYELKGDTFTTPSRTQNGARYNQVLIKKDDPQKEEKTSD